MTWGVNRRSVFLGAAAVPLAAIPAFAQGTAPVAASFDSDQVQTTPVPHRHIHGVMRSDVKFQILLPVAWNGKIAIHTRGFSGTELSAGAFQTAAVSKGYAFATCDEGWSRATIANNPQDDYYESRQSLV